MRFTNETRTPTSLRSNSPFSFSLPRLLDISRPPRLRCGGRVQHLSPDQETAKRHCADIDKVRASALTIRNRA